MDNEVVVNLGKVINKLLPEAIEKGLETVGQLIENDAKRNCPVDDGTLRASITHQVVGDSKVEIGTNVEYAPYVHEGTGIYARDGSGRQTSWVYMDAEGNFHRTSGHKPQPFLQDAVDENLDRIPRVFEGLLKDGD